MREEERGHSRAIVNDLVCMYVRACGHARIGNMD